MIEVRRNDDGTLDEIVARGVDLHLEQMDRGHWWMSIQLQDGREFHVNFTTKRAVIAANVEEM